MKDIFSAEVLENKQIADHIFELLLHCPNEAGRARVGQFISIFTGNPAMILPRPLSLCEINKEEGTFRIIYRAEGDGTKFISKYKKGELLNCLGPVGQAFRVDPNKKNVAIVGGGIGVPPLLELAKQIRKASPDAKISVYLGFRSKQNVFLEDDFKKFADLVVITTDDGSYGEKNNAVAVMPKGNEFDHTYGCGPGIMLKFLSKYSEERNIPCTVSMEEHMACSIGACLACVVKIKQGEDGWAYRRVCCSGPVFADAKELIWE